MQRIGRYEILGELGRGAMGVVYKAKDPQINRIVAIKTILTSGLDASQLSEYMSRFYREAQTAGRVSHPGIVTIHDIAEDEQGQPYLVMEFVEGVTLQGILDDSPAEGIPLERALDLGARIAEALDHAHRHDVIHRDIKPANILVMPDGRTKIADFGIARINDSEATRSSAVMGTPAYMPPEQLRGEPVDARGDIFSLGAILYRMVTGRKPFPGEDLASVSFQVVHAVPDPPSKIRPELPQDIDRVISRCLAKNSKDRYPSAMNLADDLKAIRSGQSIAAATTPRQADPTVVATIPVAQARSASVKTQKVDVFVRSRKRNTRLIAAGALSLSLVAAVFLWRPEEPASSPKPLPRRASTRSTPRRDAPTVIEFLVRDEPAPPSPAPAAPRPKPATAVPPALDEARVVTTGVTNESGRAPADAVGRPADAPLRPAPALESPSEAAPPSATSLEPVRSNAALPAKPVVPTAELHFECKHNFRSATMRISSGDREIVVTRLERRGSWILSSGKKVETNTPLPVGVGLQRLRVHVTSTDDKDPFDQVAFIEGTFNEGGVRHLVIEFPDRFLRLRWAN